VALAIFPVAVLVGFSFNPVEFRWAFHHGFKSMSDEVRDQAQKIRVYLNFLVDALILCLVATVMLRNAVPAARVGFYLGNWKSNAAIGVTAGLLLIIQMRWMLKFTTIGPSEGFTRSVRKGPVSLWVLVFVVGAFSEELWIAFCLVALTTTGHTVLVSVVVTLSVFAAMHYGYGLGGALAIGLKGAVSAILFLWTGSLIPMFLYHFIGNLGSLYRARRARRRVANPSARHQISLKHD
jgi:hypothetical protein